METLWPIWPIGLLFAVTRKNESARILSGLPWWHRVLGTGLPWRSIAGINGA